MNLRALAPVITLGLALTACGANPPAPTTSAASPLVATPLADGWIRVPAGGVQKIDGKLIITGAKILPQTAPGQVLPGRPEAYFCIFTDIDYQGTAACMTKPAPNVYATIAWIDSSGPTRGPGPLNDKVSSVRIEDGGVYKLFEDVNFGGRSLKLNRDAPWLGTYNFNGITSSLQMATGDF